MQKYEHTHLKKDKKAKKMQGNTKIGKAIKNYTHD